MAKQTLTVEQQRERALKRIQSQGFGNFVGLELGHIEPNSCGICCQLDQRHVNPNGVAHGGIIFTMMDAAAGLSALYYCDDNKIVVTQCADVHFIRSLRLGRATADARIVKLGRHTVLTEVDVTDEAGTLCARGQFEIFYVLKP